MKTKIKRTKSKDQCRKEKKNMKKNKTPNITNKSTNSNKNCRNIKSKKSNDSNKDKKTRASTSEASPPSSQHGQSAAWRRRTQAPPPCWTCCGHVQDHVGHVAVDDNGVDERIKVHLVPWSNNFKTDGALRLVLLLEQLVHHVHPPLQRLGTSVKCLQMFMRNLVTMEGLKKLAITV